jgi:hypothetical protein
MSCVVPWIAFDNLPSSSWDAVPRPAITINPECKRLMRKIELLPSNQGKQFEQDGNGGLVNRAQTSDFAI